MMPLEELAAAFARGSGYSCVTGAIVDLSLIRTDGGTQPREQILPDAVEAYASDIIAGATMPPIVVFLDGADLWLADGFHRVEAYRSLGRTEARADVHRGTQRDAILYSVGANATHGLQRTPADKRRAVEILLRDPEWSSKSDRWIAETTRTSHTFVSKMRPAPTGNVASSPTPEREGRDGKTRKLPQRPTAPDCFTGEKPAPLLERGKAYTNEEIEAVVNARMAAQAPPIFRAPAPEFIPAATAAREVGATASPPVDIVAQAMALRERMTPAERAADAAAFVAQYPEAFGLPRHKPASVRIARPCDCNVKRHPNADAIEAALRAGEGTRPVGARFGISKSALGRHLQHLGFRRP